MLWRFIRAWFAPTQEMRAPGWDEVRDAWLKEHPVCAACGGRKHLNVHHLRPVKHYPELELSPGNLLTLCEAPSRNCHLNIGHLGDWKAWNPDAHRDAILMRAKRRERRYER
jgi:5-methylcytosine-specific restriction protein A